MIKFRLNFSKSDNFWPHSETTNEITGFVVFWAWFLRCFWILTCIRILTKETSEKPKLEEIWHGDCCTCRTLCVVAAPAVNFAPPLKLPLIKGELLSRMEELVMSSNVLAHNQDRNLSKIMKNFRPDDFSMTKENTTMKPEIEGNWNLPPSALPSELVSLTTVFFCFTFWKVINKTENKFWISHFSFFRRVFYDFEPQIEAPRVAYRNLSY